jgi:hypothetical protein
MEAVVGLLDALAGVHDEILGELKAINMKLSVTAQQAKVEVKTSTRGADVTVVAYESTSQEDLDRAGNNATYEYLRVMTQLTVDAMANFVAEANRAR